MKLNYLLAVIAALVLGGCSQAYYKQVLNEEPVGNARRFPVTTDALYDAVSQSMLERNFILENENKANGFLLGKRTFQDGRRTATVLLQAKIMPCGGGQASTLYLNGVQTTEVSYVSDRTRFFLFLIPLPGGGGKQATSIKEGEISIRDAKFYGMFFKTIEEIIAKCPIAPVAVPIAPVVQAAPAQPPAPVQPSAAAQPAITEPPAPANTTAN